MGNEDNISILLRSFSLVQQHTLKVNMLLGEQRKHPPEKTIYTKYTEKVNT